MSGIQFLGIRPCSLLAPLPPVLLQISRFCCHSELPLNNIRFESDAEAFLAAKRSEVPAVKRLLTGHPFHDTFLQWAMAFADLGSWEQVLPQLRSLVEGVFRGFGQSRLLEEANKLIRDSKSRANASKVLNMVRVWQLPVSHKLLAQYQREEIEPTSLAAAPPDPARLNRIFVPPPINSSRQGDLRGIWTRKLQTVTAKQDWFTHNAETGQQVCSNMRLLAALFALGNFALASESWRSSLAPQGQLLVQVGSALVFFVVRVYPSGLIGWRARKLRDKCWCLDLSVRELDWLHCFALEDWLVLPSAWASPLRLWIETGEPGGICLREAGPTTPMLKWHCENGFPLVNEACLEHHADSTA